MAQLLVRDIEEDIKERLRLRAARHGVSMEEEIRGILRDAVLRDTTGAQTANRGLGSEISAAFTGLGLEEGTIREVRGEGFGAHPVIFQDDET